MNCSKQMTSLQCVPVF